MFCEFWADHEQELVSHSLDVSICRSLLTIFVKIVGKIITFASMSVFFVLVLVYTLMMIEMLVKNHIIVLSLICLFDFDKKRLFGLAFPICHISKANIFKVKNLKSENLKSENLKSE